MNLRSAIFLASRLLSGKPHRGKNEQRRGKTEKRHNYLRGAVAGVALSMVPLVVVLVVSDGMIQGITARYLETSTYHFQARPLLRKSPVELQKIATTLRSTDGFSPRRIFPELQGPAVAIARGRSSGAAVRAIDPVFLEDPGFADYIRVVAGRFSLNSNEIMLGEALASSLAVKVGDIVSLVTTRRGSRQGELVPRATPFRVSAIVSAGYRELDALWAFVSFSAGSRILAPETGHFFLGIKIDNPYAGDLSGERAALRRLFAKLTDVPETEIEWSVITWAEAERNLWKSFSTTKALLLLIMALAVAVASINVSSALVMLVLERRADIAILKSAGASNGTVGLVFLIAGLGTGGFGTLLGLGAGALLSWRINEVLALVERAANQLAALTRWWEGKGSSGPIKLLDPAYYLEKIPVTLDVGELALVAALSLTLCVAASLLPARRAAKLPPLELMRKS